MAIRIYALAKELNIENKALVDICTSVGITGKGSALASLDDEEIAKVKAHLSGSPPASKSAAGKSGPSKSAADQAPIRPPKAETGALKRDDYTGGRATGKIKVLDSRKKTDEPKKAASEPKSSVKEPVVKLAEMPEIQQPVPGVTSDEPKVQKPDIALPKDAIAGSRKGKAAPLGQFTKTQKKGKPIPGGKSPAQPGDDDEPMPTGKRRERGTKAKDPDAADSRMGNMRDARTKSRKSRSPRGANEDGYGRAPSRRRSRRGPAKNTAAPRKENVALTLPCTVRAFSEAAGVPAVRVCFSLANLHGVPPQTVNINSQIDEESAALLVEEFGVEVEFKQQSSLEDSLLAQFDQADDDPNSLEPRPPVVTFLGHVDHGKTSLLDYIIGTNVVSREAGGITQHIDAYQVDKDGRKISFVDTPGHEAFTEMRARGANVTDIAVLVIAADDGVMPQTEEAISHAKAANVPIVVALNKIDLPGVDPNKAMQDLTAHDLLPSEWGGEIDVVKTSATKGTGMDELLETLLVTAELHEYKANPNRPASGVCLDARQDANRGIVAKLIVQHGTLEVGDIVVCGAAHGRVKAMYDTLSPRKKVVKAGPSMPVNITGLDSAPEAGDTFHALDDIGQARELAQLRGARSREHSLSGITTKVSFEDFQKRLEEGRLGEVSEVVTLNLIIKADVRGSIEAIQKELLKVDHPEVQVKVLHAAVGGITAADVTLAHASAAVIIGFNVIPDDSARSLADERKVEIRRYDVIYKVTDDVKATLEGKLKPEERFVELGHALVKEVFQVSRAGAIAGCHVTGGSIQRGCRVRVNREGRTIGDYGLESLRRHKDDTKEVPRGMECGMKLAGFNDLKIGDVLEAYKIEEVARTL